MKKLHLKTRLITLVKRFPHFIALAIVLISAAVAIFIYLPSQKSSASGGYDFVRQIPAASYSLSATGLAVDGQDNVYAYDYSDKTIKKFASDGTYIGVIVGSSNLSSGNGESVAVNSNGDIYVSQNNVIKKFNSSGAYVNEWGSTGTGNSQFSYATGIAIDSNDNVYVSDGGYGSSSSNKIRVFDSSGNYIRQFGSYGTGDGQFNDMTGLAIDSNNNVFAVDSWNKRVQKFDSSGNYVSQFGSHGTGDGQFRNVYFIAIDSTDNVYVTDTTNTNIQKFSNTGTYLAKWGSAGTGNGQFTGTGTQSPSMRIVVDSTGKSYVTDYNSTYGNRVNIFDSSGAYQSQLGTKAPGQFVRPRGVVTDASGNLYVVDSSNYRIQKFDSSGSFVKQWGSGGSGDGQFCMSTCNEILASMAIDRTNGWIYVVDEGNLRIQKFDLNGNYLDQWGSSGSADGQFKWNEISSGIGGVAVGLNGDVYVSDHERIQRFDSNGNFQQSFTTEAGVFALASDISGNIYARTGSSIYKYNAAGALQKTINWSLSNYSTLLNGIAVDQYGDIYVTGNHSIQKLNSAGDYLSEWGGEGNAAGQFTNPSGIALAGDGKIYVSDQGGAPYGRSSNRVQEFQDNTQLSIDTTSLPGGAVGSSYSEYIYFWFTRGDNILGS